MSHLSPPSNSRPSSRPTSIACSSSISLDLSQRSTSPEPKSLDSCPPSPATEPLDHDPKDEFLDLSSHPSISPPVIASLDHYSGLNSPESGSPNLPSYSRTPSPVTTPLDCDSSPAFPEDESPDLHSNPNLSSPVIASLGHYSGLNSPESESPNLPSHSRTPSPVTTPLDCDSSPAFPEGEFPDLDSNPNPSSPVIAPLDHYSSSTSLAGELLDLPLHPRPLDHDLSLNFLQGESSDLPPHPRLPSPVIEPLNDSSSFPEGEFPDLHSHTHPPSPVILAPDHYASPTSPASESSDIPSRSRPTSIPASSPLKIPDPSPHINEILLDLQPSSPVLRSNSPSCLSSGSGLSSGSSSDSSSRSPSPSPTRLVSGGDTVLLESHSPDDGPPAEAPIPPKTSIDTGQERPFKEKPSAANEEWQRQKTEEGAANDAIDKLMQLTGLEEVKEQVLAIKAKVDICEYQGTSLERERFNVVFQGNPGTGKTTVARIYAEFLKSVNVLGSGTLHETTGAELASDGPQITKLKINGILENGGGVLFVDEAYQLTAPHASDGGRQVLDLILTEMENNIGKLVVIFVGYNAEMESFFEHNPGLSSRIPYTLQFTDFEDVELWSILRDNIAEKYGCGDDGHVRMEIQGGIDGLYMRIAIRRLARGRGIRGFGNARSVHNLLSRISDRQARRLTKIRREERRTPTYTDYFYFTKEDLIGPDPSLALFKSTAWKKLQTLIGLEKVKKSAENMIDIIKTNYRRELLEKSPLDFGLNRVLYGSPGTGKTTVAKLYGKILADLGLLSKGEVVIKNPADFIGQCLGKSEARTRAILATTVGKVLIIDEAYMLNTSGSGDKQDSYKAAVIDTLVAEVQGVPGDDRCVLLLGYEDKLKEMFRNANPGLSRRFAIDDPFHFQDFDMRQLKLVLDLKMKEQDLSATQEAMCVALEVLDRARMRPNFGNGGEVDNFLDRAKLNYQERQSKKDLEDRDFDVLFLPEDFDPKFDRDGNAIANIQKMLGGRVDKDIIVKLVDYQSRVRIAKACKLDPRTLVPTNFVFKGPPGTGKTTTARLMGKVYYDMGFLSTDEVVECSASDLIGQYVGHTGPKTKTQLDKALGKVLFIDEAYRLAEGQYATEAVNELNYLLTLPKYAGKMIIILAGYTQDMNRLMTARRALSTLFPVEIVFRNINPDDCIILLHRELKELNISAPFLERMSEKHYRELRRLVQALSVFPSWSNARDIKTLAQDMSATVFKQILATSTSETGATETSAPETSSAESLAPEATCGTPETTLSPEHAFECMKRLFIMHYERSGSQKMKLPPVDNVQAASQPTKVAEDPATDCGGCDTSIEVCDSSTRVAPERPKNVVNPLLHQTKGPSQSRPLPSFHRPHSDAGTIQENGVSDEESEQLQDEEELEQLQDEEPEQPRDEEPGQPRDDDESEQLQDEEESEQLQDDEQAPRLQTSAPRKTRQDNKQAPRVQKNSPGKTSKQVPRFWRDSGWKARQDDRDVSRFRKLIPWRAQKSSGREPNQRQAVQQKQKKMGTCEAGFEWREEGSGWRCLGGSHFTQDI